MTERIYLDNAATSWPKPENVYRAIDHYLRDNGSALSRGATEWGVQVSRTVSQTRMQVAKLIGSTESNRVVFTQNGTDSINLALHGILKPGDHVVTSLSEHNSVLRPLHHLENEFDVSVTRVPVDQFGFYDPDQVKAAITSSTKLVALTHASNVTGCIQPAAAVGQICRDHNLLFLLDAAQSAGHIAIDVGELNADLLATPGHKGLLGPLGIGVLFVGSRAETSIRPSRQGGTGTLSELASQPSELPERLECGNHNVPGIFGLGAGVDYIVDQGVDAIHKHELDLTKRFVEMLANQNAFTIHSPPDRRVGLVSLSHREFEPHDLANILESSVGVACRAGLHCAPLIHQSIGTFQRGGTVRFSVGPFNTVREIETVGEFLLQLS